MTRTRRYADDALVEGVLWGFIIVAMLTFVGLW